MQVNIEIIFNLCIAMLIYRIVINAIAKNLMVYFLDRSKTIQGEKKTFQEKVREKLKEEEKP
jgi:hypothetical protein